MSATKIRFSHAGSHMINVQNIERHLTLNTINDSRVDIHKHSLHKETNSRTFAHISVSQHSHTQQTRQCPVAGFQARDVFVSCKPASGNVNMFSFNLISINEYRPDVLVHVLLLSMPIFDTKHFNKKKVVMSGN